MFELGMGSRIRKSPYFNAAVAAGAKTFTVYNHMYMPVSYGDPVGEYERLTRGVAIWDVAAERQVEINGRDATKLVRLLTPRDLSKQKVGQGKYAPICDHDGRLLNDPIVLRVATNRYWLSIADSDLLLWVRAIAAERNFKVKVLEPDVSPLAIQGPKAEDVAAKLFGEDIRSLKFFWFRELELDGIPLVVQRSGWSKQGGFELYLQNASDGERLWKLVMKAGKRFKIGPGAPNGIERVESVLISFGTDADWDANPLELGFGKYMHLDRDDEFIGKSALRKIAKKGTKKALLGLNFTKPIVAPSSHPWALSYKGEKIGEVRVAVPSVKFSRSIGLAYVDRKIGEKLLAENKRVDVASEFGKLKGTFTPIPFHD